MTAGYGSRADIRKRRLEDAEQHAANLAATWKERYEELAGELVETRAALGGALDHAEARDRENAELRAVVAAVEALVDECAASGCIHLNDMWGRVRAALADAPAALGESRGCVPCRVCGGSQNRGWHKHDTEDGA